MSDCRARWWRHASKSLSARLIPRRAPSVTAKKAAATDMYVLDSGRMHEQDEEGILTIWPCACVALFTPRVRGSLMCICFRCAGSCTTCCFSGWVRKCLWAVIWGRSDAWDFPETRAGVRGGACGCAGRKTAEGGHFNADVQHVVSVWYSVLWGQLRCLILG